MLPQALSIDVVSDIMCPWCYIGKRRLEQALATLEGVPVDIRWRPFQLDQTIPEDGMDRQEYLSKKFGGPEGAAQVYQPIRDAGEREGIPFDFDAIKISPNTLNAHRIIRWSHSMGLQNEIAERLFQLYFIEGADLTDKTVLTDAAESVGMEREIVERLINSDADLEETKQEITLAQQMGVTGVPTFIIGQKYAVVGAQTPEVIAGAIMQALQEAEQPEFNSSSEGSN